MPRPRKEEAPVVSPDVKNKLLKKIEQLNSRYYKENKLDPSSTKPRVRLGAELEKPDLISTGNPALDWALGGGIPEGTVVEIYGQPNSSKTVSAAYLMAEVQKRGKYIIYYSTEESTPPFHAWELAGVDPSKVIFVDSRKYGEDGLNAMRQLVMDETGLPDPDIGLIVIDSISSLAPAAEVKSTDEKGEEGVTVGRLAALTSKMFRGIAGTGWTLEGCTICIINQERSQISIVPMPNLPTGGNAVRFYPKIVIHLKSGSKNDLIYDENKNVIGNTVRFTIEKNNTGTAPPYRSGSWTYRYMVGIDTVTPAINTAMECGVIQLSGRTYTIRWIEEVERDGETKREIVTTSVVGRKDLDELAHKQEILDKILHMNSEVLDYAKSHDIEFVDGIAVQFGKQVDVVELLLSAEEVVEEKGNISDEHN